jgi:hypothetical protein
MRGQHGSDADIAQTAFDPTHTFCTLSPMSSLIATSTNSNPSCDGGCDSGIE